MSEKTQSHPGPDSLAFIVRIWRGGRNNRWRFSVQHVATGERRGFSDLEKLFTYFRQQVDEAADSVLGPSDDRGNH